MSYTYIFLYRVGEWKRHATYWESWIYGGGCETLEKKRAGGQGDWLTIYQVSRGIQLLSASRILLVEMIYSNTFMATKHDF